MPRKQSVLCVFGVSQNFLEIPFLCVWLGSMGWKKGELHEPVLAGPFSVRTWTRQLQGVWGGGDFGTSLGIVGHWELMDQPNKKENRRTNSLGSGSDPNVVSLKLTQFGCLLKTKNIKLPHFCKSDKSRRPCQHVLGPLGGACAREGPWSLSPINFMVNQTLFRLLLFFWLSKNIKTSL